MNTLKIRVSSSESERKGILWQPGQWTKANYQPNIFKSGQLRPSESGTKQELQSPGKLVLIQFGDLWAQSAKQRCRDACPRSASRQVSFYTIPESCLCSAKAFQELHKAVTKSISHPGYLHENQITSKNGYFSDTNKMQIVSGQETENIAQPS